MHTQPDNATAEKEFLSKNDIELLAKVYCDPKLPEEKRLTQTELEVFVGVVQRTKLDPFARQIFVLKRWSNQENRHILSIQTSIDGFRLIAQRTREYRGQTPVQWCGPDGVWKDVWLSKDPPAAARVGVHREGFAETLFSVARWESYKQESKSGLTPMWRKMPDLMLAKCSEAGALRKAFAQELSGLYVEEELDQAANEEIRGPKTAETVSGPGAQPHITPITPVVSQTTTAAASPSPSTENPPTPAPATPVSHPDSLESLKKWLQTTSITPEFVIAKCVLGKMIEPTVKTLDQIPHEALRLLESEKMRARLYQLWFEEHGEKKPKAEPADGTDQTRKIRQYHPDNPFRTDFSWDWTKFELPYSAFSGKTIEQIPQKDALSFYNDWSPKAGADGKIKDISFRWDAVLVRWGEKYIEKTTQV